MSPAVRLWRIEHPKDGIGPFQSMDYDLVSRPYLQSCQDWDVDNAPPVNPHSMPLPEEERVIRKGDLPHYSRGRAYDRPELRKFKFAFPTLALLRRWFTGWALRDLTRMGYVVKVVQVPWEAHTRYKSQCGYDTTRAHVLREVAPVDLLWTPCGRAISALL